MLQKFWVTFCQENPTGGRTLQEDKMHINILELNAVKLALMSFHRQIKMTAIHFQIENTTP